MFQISRKLANINHRYSNWKIIPMFEDGNERYPIDLLATLITQLLYLMTEWRYTRFISTPRAVPIGDAFRWGLMVVGPQTYGGTHGHLFPHLTPGRLIRDKTGSMGERTSDPGEERRASHCQN